MKGQQRIERINSDHFGFALFPNYRFGHLVRDFLNASWLGRGVYITSHLFGAIPYFQVIGALVRRIFIEAAQKQRVESQPSLQDKKVDQQPSLQSARKKSDAKVESYAPPVHEIDDFALARLMQEEIDYEDAKKLQKTDEKFIKRPKGKNFASDEDVARRLQAELYREAALS